MTKQIPLSGPNGEGKFVLVDDEDFAVASVHSWYLRRGYVATSTGERRNQAYLPLHHLVFGNPPAGFVVDHIDGDPLNNQRDNLRIATLSQNAQNKRSKRNSSSRFKGVSWISRQRVWGAEIQVDGEKIYLGYFMSELDAARAYNAAAAKYFGEYARLNIIPDDADESVRYRQASPNADNRTSKYRGVHFFPRSGRWVAGISAKRKAIHLGYFDTEEEAARAYDAAAKIHHGDRAFLNFLD